MSYSCPTSSFCFTCNSCEKKRSSHMKGLCPSIQGVNQHFGQREFETAGTWESWAAGSSWEALRHHACSLKSKWLQCHWTFFFFFLLNTASTCKSFRLWSLDKLEFRANKWLEWLKRMLSKCISSVRSKMRWGRGGAHIVSLDTLFEADFILPLIQSQQYPTLSLDCSLHFEKLTGSYPFCFCVLLSF